MFAACARGHLLKQLSSGTYFSRQVEGRPCAGKDKVVKNSLVTQIYTTDL